MFKAIIFLFLVALFTLFFNITGKIKISIDRSVLDRNTQKISKWILLVTKLFLPIVLFFFTASHRIYKIATCKYDFIQKRSILYAKIEKDPLRTFCKVEEDSLEKYLGLPKYVVKSISSQLELYRIYFLCSILMIIVLTAIIVCILVYNLRS